MKTCNTKIPLNGDAFFEDSIFKNLIPDLVVSKSIN